MKMKTKIKIKVKVKVKVKGEIRVGIRIEAETESKGTSKSTKDKEQKSRNLAHWAYESGRLIVATNALGLGIDVPDIRAVVHAERPASLVEYGQESGRAGRDGQASEAVIVDSGERWMRAATQYDVGNERARAEMDRFMSGRRCRRAVIDGYMDGNGERTRCRGEEGEVVCDVCEADLQKEQQQQRGEQGQEREREREQQEQERLFATFQQQQRGRRDVHKRFMQKIADEVAEVEELNGFLEFGD
ncbi:P-loop containing nucleoside triphosphate hydrolase protein [Macrophomina phaseolina]|uniref:DNA 3'-5' helicase n=1 Tax=Macrophomina phaseolina TaxID=35725 RepID=A0ABQ8FVI1_9PEZI|nr:P-loop containing nucleoside triphosphate hydrolase protein [Macrophomina phaseolina]